MEKLLQLRTALEWRLQLQQAIDFIISETPPDTFLERAEEIQEILIVLKQLRNAFLTDAKENGSKS